MKRITSHEIRELKKIIRKQNQEIINLNAQIYELEHQLKESKAKEGKGCLETMLKNLTKAFASLDFSKLIEMNPELLDITGQEDDTNDI